MSMRYYSFNDYGLVLSEEDVIYFAEKLRQEKEPNVEPFTDENSGVFDAQEYAEEYICYVGSFEGELVKIDKESGQDCCDGILDADDTVFYIPPNNYPSFFSNAYKNYEDIVNEYKSTVGKYLPEDFDYENNIRHIVGTIFG